MAARVKIMVLEAELFDTPCAEAVANAMPFGAKINHWGDEFYFDVPVNLEPDETATKFVKVGDIGYWPEGNADAIFFGKTPSSTANEPVAYSEVNLIGKVQGDAKKLKEVYTAEKIKFVPIV